MRRLWYDNAKRMSGSGMRLMKQLLTKIKSAAGPLTAIFLLCLMLSGCGRQETGQTPPEPDMTAGAPEAGAEETPQPVNEYTLPYRVRTVRLADGDETVLFQQEDEKGFLALINRKTGEEIPQERAEDPDFVNDGRYEIYETEVVHIGVTGERSEPENYVASPAPPFPGGVFSYVSQSGPVALRLADDGSMLSLERSSEHWRDADTEQKYNTRSFWLIRTLKRDGTELGSHRVEALDDSGGVNEKTFTVLDPELFAVAREKSILFFGRDGGERFSVTTPMPVQELCRCRDGRLAVLLRDGMRKWLSLIEPESRSVGIPQKLPDGAHLVCAGTEADTLCFVRNTELFRLGLSDWSVTKIISLLELGIDPVSVAGFFTREDGSLHFVQHDWDPETEKSTERYCVARPADLKKEGILLRIGFGEISGTLQRALIDFNRSRSDVHIQATDLRNLDGDGLPADLPELIVPDGDQYDQLLREGRLADLTPLLEEDEEYGAEDLFPNVKAALSDGDGALRRMAAGFRIESMACDYTTVSGRSILKAADLRELLSRMPAGSSLYEPWYTADRLLRDLEAVNRGTLSPELVNFAAVQPESYDYSRYAADSAGAEKRIYDGRLLMLQAHVATMEEFKWYDALFESGAAFPGWPTEEGSASRLCFDETVAVSAAASEERQRAAWQFMRVLLSEDYGRGCYGFPVRRSVTETILAEDMAAVSYRMDEDGEFELTKKGEKIEIPRSSWYSGEWRQHYVYALTEGQRDRLLALIESAV